MMLKQLAMLVIFGVFAQLAGAQQATGVDIWRPVASRSAGDVLKIKLKNGSSIKGKFKSASDAGLVLELKNKELSLSREEIASVAVLGRKSAGKTTIVGTAVGGGLGAGAGAVVGAAVFGNPSGFCCPRGKSAAVGAGVGGGMGAVLGSLIGLIVGLSGHTETVIYQDMKAKEAPATIALHP